MMERGLVQLGLLQVTNGHQGTGWAGRSSPEHWDAHAPNHYLGHATAIHWAYREGALL